MTIDELREIQQRHGGWLPPAELRALRSRIELPLYELNGVATFYPEFRVEPPPAHSVKVCLDLSCHLRGSYALYQELKALTEPGGPFDGRKIEVKGCSCLGQCDRAPAIVLEDHHVAIGPDRARLVKVARETMEGEEPQIPAPPALNVNKQTDPYKSREEHYTIVRELAASKNYDNVIEQLKQADLRGMGGAGFNAWRKWTEIKKAQRRAVMSVSSTGGLVNADATRVVEKYVVCNADESEVGTFKDREIMLGLPHLLVEAMTIAGLTCGASKGWIYIRHEYPDQADACRREIDRARQLGVLGADACGSGQSFDLEVFVSPGGYILGEQSAMLEALEGKRGQPRNRRTDIGAEGSAALSGLFNGPTLINNVETFAYIPLILKIGGEAFAKMGVNECKGLKWVGISGDVERPGVYEIPLGTTYEQMLRIAGGVRDGRQLKAFCPSGPSYGIHPPSMLGTPSNFGRFDDDVPRVGSGAVVFLDETRCVVDVALNLTQFFRNESCGKCVPCRVGSSKMVELARDISEARPLRTDESIENSLFGAEEADGSGNGAADGEGDAERRLLERIVDRLATTLNITSLCGLGQVVHMPIAAVLKNWPEEIDRHLAGKCSAGVCKDPTRRRA
jgi:NADH:ubiquinone oxidoreductase subunit F (NADH-binding)/NADH:ubiquinone oxidoreductase subunit E